MNTSRVFCNRDKKQDSPPKLGPAKTNPVLDTLLKRILPQKQNWDSKLSFSSKTGGVVVITSYSPFMLNNWNEVPGHHKGGRAKLEWPLNHEN